MLPSLHPAAWMAQVGLEIIGAEAAQFLVIAHSHRPKPTTRSAERARNPKSRFRLSREYSA